MPLTKSDLSEIKKIVGESESRLNGKIETSEKNIITIISNEVSDLADINRAVITRTEEIDCRLRIVERKLGLV